MSGTMPSALHNIISFNPHKIHVMWLLSLSPVYDKKINQDKWKDYTGLMFTSTLRFPFHDIIKTIPLHI